MSEVELIKRFVAAAKEQAAAVYGDEVVGSISLEEVRRAKTGGWDITIAFESSKKIPPRSAEHARGEFLAAYLGDRQYKVMHLSKDAELQGISDRFMADESA